MYKYFHYLRKRGAIMTILYCIFAIRIARYTDKYGNIKIYAKLNWWHPIVILMTLILLLSAIIKSLYKIVTVDLVGFLAINNDDCKKGVWIGYYKENYGNKPEPTGDQCK